MKDQKLQRSVAVVLVLMICLTMFMGADNTLISAMSSLVSKPVELTHPIVKAGQTDQAKDRLSDSLAAEFHLNLRTGKVIRRNITMYAREVLINIGSKSGVETDMFVVAQGELFGRVEKVYGDSSWIRLVSDPVFRLGVQIDSVPAEAILKGANTSLIVDRIPKTDSLEGRRVTTYGNEKQGIAGVPIGVLVGDNIAADSTSLQRYNLDRTMREEYISKVSVISPEERQ